LKKALAHFFDDVGAIDFHFRYRKSCERFTPLMSIS
jgi:hypothetical protein